MVNNQSTNFPFMLNYNSKTYINATSYDLSSNINNVFHITGSDNMYTQKYEFENLDWDSSVAANFQIANLYYYQNNQMVLLPLDMIINHTALNSMVEFYNSHTTPTRTASEYIDNYFIDINNSWDVIRIIKYLKFISTISTDIYDKFNNSKYSQLYNDKDSNVEFATKIYRSAPRHKATVTDGRIDSIIPIFKVINSENSDLKAYINIRNFKIPMKVVKTSTKDNKYNYIFIYPEYLIENYKQNRDAIRYIEFNNNPPSEVYFSYIDETAETPTVWNPKMSGTTEIEYINLGNTFVQK